MTPEEWEEKKTRFYQKIENEFYKTIDHIVLFPGSLEELNHLEKLNSSNKVYDLMPNVDNIKDNLIGEFIFHQKLSDLKNHIEGWADSFLITETKPAQRKATIQRFQMDDVIRNLHLLEDPKRMGQEIRVKVRDLGADGLIHFQLYETTYSFVGGCHNYYTGVPVVLK